MYFNNFYYMSPEFKNHIINKEITKFAIGDFNNSDIFSFGLILL